MRAISQRRSIRPLREHSSITREEYREAYLQRAERFGKDWAAREIVRRHFFRNSCQEIIVEGPRDLPDVKCLVKDGGVVVELKVKDQLRFERKCARAESRDKNLATFRDFMEFEREEAACLDAAINWARSNNGRGGVEFVEVPNEAEGTENLRRALIELVFPRLKAAGWNLPVKN
jgi:adenylate kinase family enzyme